jgi:hypothetical protein
MTRRVVLGALLAFALSFGGSAQRGIGADDKDHKHGDHFTKCAKACADCMLECEMCARHCADMVIKGESKHAHTMGTCVDCADLCAAAAKIVGRKGPMSVTTCEACAKVCDVCGKACEEFPKDAHMKKCAKACRDCAKACREMVKHAKSE